MRIKRGSFCGRTLSRILSHWVRRDTPFACLPPTACSNFSVWNCMLTVPLTTSSHRNWREEGVGRRMDAWQREDRRLSEWPVRRGALTLVTISVAFSRDPNKSQRLLSIRTGTYESASMYVRSVTRMFINVGTFTACQSLLSSTYKIMTAYKVSAVCVVAATLFGVQLLCQPSSEFNKRMFPWVTLLKYNW